MTTERDKAFMATVALHLRSDPEQEGETAMGAQSTAAEGRFELEEKYRRWKETYLPAGDATATYPLDQQLQALGDERLIAAHDEAMAGLTAEKLLAHIKPIGNFHYAAGLTTGLLFKRGLMNRRSWCE